MPATNARMIPRGMPERSRPSRLAWLMPTSADAFLRRRLAELSGLAHIAVAIALIAALSTFSAGDPSWDAALPPRWAHHTRNVLGLPGSYFADIFVQTLGLASYLLPAAIAAWGARLLRHRAAAPLWRRTLLLFPGLFFAAATLAPFTPLPAWPLAVSMGGSVGQAILNLGGHGLAPFLGLGGKWAAWAISTGLAAVLLSAALGIRFSDWRAAFAAVSGLVFWTGGQLGRFRHAADDEDAPAPARPKAAAGRKEPALDGKVLPFSQAA